MLVIGCPRGSIPFSQIRRSVQSSSPLYDGHLMSLRRLGHCLPNCPDWDPIGRRNPADRCCSSGRPQRLPCTRVSMWDHYPIRRPSSTFVPFQCRPICPTRRDQQHHPMITGHRWPLLHSRTGDGRKSGEVSSFPFKCGYSLAWDVTCTDSISAINVYSTNLSPGSASSAAEDLKKNIYSQLVVDYELVPVAFETSRIIRMLPFN